MKRSAYTGASWLLLAALTAASCASDPTPAPGVMVAVRTDMQVPEKVASVGLFIDQIKDGSTRSVFAEVIQTSVSETGERFVQLPAELAVQASGALNESVRVQVVGFDDSGNPLVLREARVSMPTKRGALLPLPLLWMNSGDANGPTAASTTAALRLRTSAETPLKTVYRSQFCAEDETLDARGECATIDIKEGDLADWDPSGGDKAPSGDMVGGLNDGENCSRSCYDVQRCLLEPGLGGTEPLTVTVEALSDDQRSCGVPVGDLVIGDLALGALDRTALDAWRLDEASPLSVAMKLGKDEGGVCPPGEASCWLPLQQPAKFTRIEKGGKPWLQLPSAICRKRLAGETVELRVSARCAPLKENESWCAAAGTEAACIDRPPPPVAPPTCLDLQGVTNFFALDDGSWVFGLAYPLEDGVVALRATAEEIAAIQWQQVDAQRECATKLPEALHKALVDVSEARKEAAVGNLALVYNTTFSLHDGQSGGAPGLGVLGMWRHDVNAGRRLATVLAGATDGTFRLSSMAAPVPAQPEDPVFFPVGVPLGSVGEASGTSCPALDAMLLSVRSSTANLPTTPSVYEVDAIYPWSCDLPLPYEATWSQPFPVEPSFSAGPAKLVSALVLPFQGETFAEESSLIIQHPSEQKLTVVPVNGEGELYGGVEVSGAADFGREIFASAPVPASWLGQGERGKLLLFGGVAGQGALPVRMGVLRTKAASFPQFEAQPTATSQAVTLPDAWDPKSMHWGKDSQALYLGLGEAFLPVTTPDATDVRQAAGRLLKVTRLSHGEFVIAELRVESPDELANAVLGIAPMVEDGAAQASKVVALTKHWQVAEQPWRLRLQRVVTSP